MKELVRILKEELGWCESGLNKLDELCKAELDEILNIQVKKNAQDLIEDVKNLVEDIKKVSETKEEISSILHDIEAHKDLNGLDEEKKEHILKQTLSSYDHIKISINKDKLDYHNIVEKLRTYPNMDFVVHYNFILFEPLYINEWKKQRLDTKAILVLYAKDLEKTGRSKDALKNIYSLIGRKVIEEDPYKDYEKRIYKLVNEIGLHARPAAQFVQMANKYKGLEIKLRKKGDPDAIEGKSIMGVMLLAAGKGTEFEIMCRGDDKEKRAFYKDILSVTDYNHNKELEKVFEYLA